MRFKYQRNESGASLVAMLTMSVLVGIVTSSLMATLLPSYKKIGELKNGNRVRALAEAGVDHAVQELCNAKKGKKGSAFDPPPAPGQKITVVLPKTVTNDKDADVVVEVKTVANPPNSSMLFDPLLNKELPNSYRQITCTATVGGTTKQIRCLLQPILTAPPQRMFPYAGFGIARLVFVGQSGSNSYNTKDGRVGADLASLGKISQVGTGSLTRGNTQGGSHYEYPDPVSYYNQQFGIVGDQFNAKPVSSAPWMQMMGNVYSNGVNTAYHPRQQMGNPLRPEWTSNHDYNYNNPAENVLGVTNGLDNGIPTGHAGGQGQTLQNTGKWTGGHTNFSGDVRYQQPSIPPAPSAPSGTMDLGNIKLTNGATLEIAPGAPKPSGPIGTVSGKTVRIPPGDYVARSISLSGASKINIVNGGGQDTTLYLQGASGGGNIVSVSNDSSINMTGINGTGMNTSGKNGVKGGSAPNQLTVNDPMDTSLGNIAETSGSARELQIFTNSSQTMQLQGNQRMVIYAPYSTINIGSTESGGNVTAIAKDANLYGAVVGGVINIMASYSQGGGAYLHYDRKLRPKKYGDYLDPYARISPFENGDLDGYRAVTWQEAIKANKNNPDDPANWKYRLN
jgi:hypothetical protein